MKLKNSIIIFALQLVIALLVGCSDIGEDGLIDLSQEEENASDMAVADISMENDEESDPQENLICVHISGAVVNPGLYELVEGSRLYDGVMAAGGFTDDAAVEYSNLAEVLLDGVKYHIYSNDDIESGAVNESGPLLESHYNTAGQLNINLATADELMELSGIGESKALAIIEYREQNGSFGSIEEVMNVSGIGEGLFSRIQDSITVN